MKMKDKPKPKDEEDDDERTTKRRRPRRTMTTTTKKKAKKKKVAMTTMMTTDDLTDVVELDHLQYHALLTIGYYQNGANFVITKGPGKKTDEFKANFPTYNKEVHTDMPDGEKVIYKYHICPALGDYLDRTRKIISNFLYENKIMHKTVGTNPWARGKNSFEANIADEDSTQYGKSSQSIPGH